MHVLTSVMAEYPWATWEHLEPLCSHPTSINCGSALFCSAFWLPFTWIILAEDASTSFACPVNTCMQKSLSPLLLVAVTFVTVCAKAAGIKGFSCKSTLTEDEPFLTGNASLSNVSDPSSPPIKPHFFDDAASPEQ